jgi:hypothetical protein
MHRGPMGGTLPLWFPALRERRFARRFIRQLLRSYSHVHGANSDLRGRALYREVLLHSKVVGPTEVDQVLLDADNSVDEWTAPGREALGFREVAHFALVSRHRALGHAGALVSFAAIVTEMIPADL